MTEAQADWHSDGEESYDRPSLTLGDMRSGETIRVGVTAEPELKDGEYGDMLVVPVQFHVEESDYVPEVGGDGDNQPDPHTVEEGEELDLLSGSKRLRTALTEVDRETDGDGIGGLVLDIHKRGTGQKTEYSAEVVSDD